jgi:hypothetical protein
LVLGFLPPLPLPQAGSRQRTGGRKAWTGQRPRVFPWVFRLTSRVALGSKMRNARVRDSSSIWSRRPHPRRERERILGPSLITFGTIAPMLWGWANLKPALSSLGTDRSIAFTFYAVQLAGLFALGCTAYCLIADPGSTAHWRDHNPLAASSPCRVCALPRPPDAHHCRTCDLCVVGHDHHCCILGVCIAEGNRRVFITLLGLGTFCYASMSALTVCTWTWLKDGGRQDDTALARTYAPPAALFFVLGLVIGVFCLLQIACLCLGVRSKSPALLWAIGHALIGRTAPAAAPKVEEEDNDSLEEPGCCACIQAQHHWGLGGVVPGASLVTSHFGKEQTQRAGQVRTLAGLVALAEWATAAYLLQAYGSGGQLAGLALLLVSGGLSIRCLTRLADFTNSRHHPNPDATCFPASAALSPQPTIGAAGELVLAEAEPEESSNASDQALGHLLGSSMNIEWCKHCAKYVRRPSAHCRDCDRCVMLMDHHCSLLLVCIGSDNRRRYCDLLGSAFVVGFCHLLAALPALPHACEDAPRIFSEVTNATQSGEPLLSELREVTRVHALGLQRCVSAAALSFIVAYSLVAIAAFAFQQVVFYVLVAAGPRRQARGFDWRTWALDHVFMIPYWRRQREQMMTKE